MTQFQLAREMARRGAQQPSGAVPPSTVGAEYPKLLEVALKASQTFLAGRSTKGQSS